MFDIKGAIGFGLIALLMIGGGYIGSEQMKAKRLATAQEQKVQSTPTPKATTAPIPQSPVQADSAWYFENAEDISEGKKASSGKKMVTTVESIFTRYSSLPEVAEMNKLFGKKLYVSFYSKSTGGTVSVSEGKDPRFVTNSTDPNALEIVLFGLNDYQTEPRLKQDSQLFYSSDWRALMLGAVKYSDQVWFDAFLTHEMFHALKHRQGSPSAVTSSTNDQWVDEEVHAHLIEEKVLNIGTAGKYSQAITGIVGRVMKKNPSTVLEFYRAAATDENTIDSLFHPGVPSENYLRQGEYMLSLLFEWVRRRVPEGQRRQENIKMYREIIEISRSQ